MPGRFTGRQATFTTPSPKSLRKGEVTKAAARRNAEALHEQYAHRRSTQKPQSRLTMSAQQQKKQRLKSQQSTVRRSSSKLLSEDHYHLDRVHKAVKCPPKKRSEAELNLVATFLHDCMTRIKHGGNLLFADVDMATCGHLAEMVTEHHLEPGEVLFRQGDPGDKYFMTLKGSVTVSRRESAGDEHDKVLAHLRPGVSFGEIALLQPVPRTATITAGDDGADLLAVTKLEYRSVLRKAENGRMRDRAELLLKTGLFPPEAGWEDIVPFTFFFRFITFGKGDAVISAGQRVNYLFVLVRGALDVYAEPEEEIRKSTAALTAITAPGSIVAAHGAATEKPKDTVAPVTAMVRSWQATLLQLPRRDIRKLEPTGFPKRLKAQAKMRLKLYRSRARALKAAGKRIRKIRRAMKRGGQRGKQSAVEAAMDAANLQRMKGFIKGPIPHSMRRTRRSGAAAAAAAAASASARSSNTALVVPQPQPQQQQNWRQAKQGGPSDPRGPEVQPGEEPSSSSSSSSSPAAVAPPPPPEQEENKKETTPTESPSVEGPPTSTAAASSERKSKRPRPTTRLLQETLAAEESRELSGFVEDEQMSTLIKGIVAMRQDEAERRVQISVDRRAESSGAGVTLGSRRGWKGSKSRSRRKSRRRQSRGRQLPALSETSPSRGGPRRQLIRAVCTPAIVRNMQQIRDAIGADTDTAQVAGPPASVSPAARGDRRRVCYTPAGSATFLADLWASGGHAKQVRDIRRSAAVQLIDRIQGAARAGKQRVRTATVRGTGAAAERASSKGDDEPLQGGGGRFGRGGSRSTVEDGEQREYITNGARQLRATNANAGTERAYAGAADAAAVEAAAEWSSTDGSSTVTTADEDMSLGGQRMLRL